MKIIYGFRLRLSDQLIGCHLPLNYYSRLLIAGSASINNKVAGWICCGGNVSAGLSQFRAQAEQR
jgi:hypothetical protein